MNIKTFFVTMALATAIGCVEEDAGLLEAENIPFPSELSGTETSPEEAEPEPLADSSILQNNTGCPAGQTRVTDTGLCVRQGNFRITLSWTPVMDLDLYVQTPLGLMYYRNRNTSDGGRLLQDGCISGRCYEADSPFGETALWTGNPTPGTYEFWAVNYRGGQAVPFVMEVEHNGQREVFRGTLGSARGAASNRFAFTIEGTAPQNPDANTQCLQTLSNLGIQWRTWNYRTQRVSGKSCTIVDPITTTSTINGITYQYLDNRPSSGMNMACDTALALHKLGDVLKAKNINRVKHMGIFNCRLISGSTRLSEHSFGNAIDFWQFVGNDGTNYSVLRDFQKGRSNPTTQKGRVLLDIAQQMHNQRIFNIVLTPNYNQAHRDHFHADLTSGRHTLRANEGPEFYYDELPEGSCSGH